MKRCVLKAGRSSLAISMPRSYIDEHQIIPGQEMDVMQHGSALIITCDKPKSRIKTIDLSDLSNKTREARILDKIIGALFRQGGDTFEIKVRNEKTSELLREIIRKGKLSMYEEPNPSGENSFVIHSPISQFDEKTLENLTNAIIKNIYLTMERLADSISEGYLTQVLADELVAKDRIINEHTDICKRIINKTVLNYKSTSQYNFVDRTEKIGDAVKYLVNIAFAKKALAKKYLLLINGTKDLFFMLLSAHANFSIKKMSEFYESSYLLEEGLADCKDAEMYHCLKTIITIVKDSYSDLMVRSL